MLFAFVAVCLLLVTVGAEEEGCLSHYPLYRTYLQFNRRMNTNLTESADQLQLPTLSSTTFTTIEMGELRETFVSDEVRVTLRSPTWTAELSHSDKQFIKKHKISIE
ncbi:hypothetical protein COOONC_11819 [Cooperia oncophora]